jgi:hypothetical protein
MTGLNGHELDPNEYPTPPEPCCLSAVDKFYKGFHCSHFASHFRLEVSVSSTDPVNFGILSAALSLLLIDEFYPQAIDSLRSDHRSFSKADLKRP